MSEAFDSKNWEEARKVYEETMPMFEETLKDEEATEHVKSLPLFLRRLTRGAVLAYVVTKGVEVLERFKLHGEATQVLNKLIAQELYLPHYHGHWYERLVLDLDQHLKSPSRALEAVNDGLDDRHVREARRLALFQRVAMIKNRKKKEDCEEQLSQLQQRKDWKALPDKTPAVTIQGRLLPKEQTGGKTVFVYESSRDGGDAMERETTLCSVEEYVREWYRFKKDLEEGLHAEGAVVNTVCAVLFWDVIYNTTVADAFRSPNQHAPLDLDTDSFYENRRAAIDARLSEIRDMSAADLSAQAKSCWEQHHGVASLVKWDLFRSADHLCGLLGCFSGAQLAGICLRLLKNHRHTRSGFPDLTLWNPGTRTCEIVEVKGPGDRLSNKQVLWIDYLNSLGVEAHVCHVEAVAGRGVKRRIAQDDE